MFKKIILLGVISGIFSGIASVIYAQIYFFALGADFSKIITVAGILSSSVFGCILAASGYLLLVKWLKNKGEIIFNFLFTILSMVSIVVPFIFKLPLDIEMPELFPGLTVPMHFFPVLSWFTLRPLFIKNI